MVPLHGKTKHERTISKFVNRAMQFQKEIGEWSVMKTYVQNHVTNSATSANTQITYAIDGSEGTSLIFNNFDNVDPITASQTVTEYVMKNAALIVQYKVHKDVIIKNNNLFKCKLRVYDAFCKTFTSNDVAAAMTDGLAANEPITSFPSSKLGIRPQDAQPVLGQSYRVENFRYVELLPGEELNLVYTSGWMEWDYESYTNNSSAEYKKGQHQFLIQQYGTPYHDSTTPTTVGISPTQVDIYWCSRFKYHLRYSGDVRTVHENEASLGTVTNKYQVEPYAPAAETTL